MKKKLRLKPFVLPSLYLVLLVALMFLATNSLNTKETNNEELTYVSGTIFNTTVPVVGATEAKIIRPYVSEKVETYKAYYDYKAESEDQQNAIIYHEDTYMQNSGITYSADESFNVVSILNGTVIKVTENELLGTTVEIRHDSNIISIYQSLSDVTVSEGDYISQNQTLAKSGTSKIDSNLTNKLHFELFYNGKVVNPENFFDKSLNEI